jgi:hypothetical protein
MENKEITESFLGHVVGASSLPLFSCLLLAQLPGFQLKRIIFRGQRR